MMNDETIFSCDGCGKELTAFIGETPKGLCFDCYEDKPPQKAMKDMVLFVAEFEEWLEAEYKKWGSKMASSRIQPTEAECIESDVWFMVMEQYRELKKRVEDND